MLALLLLHWLTFLHALFISVTSLEYNQQEKSIEISSRIFTDDLEAALARQNGAKVSLLKPANKQETERQLSAYLQQHLRIAVNGKPVGIGYVGYTIEEDAVWCFLEIKDVVNIKELAITNNVLFEMHDKQSNLLHVMVGGKRKSIKLDNPTNRANFRF